MADSGASSYTVFTCLSCQVSFGDSDGQRDHFRSDWHRYNLMRKVADLPPVSMEMYNVKVEVMKQTVQAEAEADKKSHCVPCKKSFGSKKAYSNHINSKKHLQTSSLYKEEVTLMSSENCSKEVDNKNDEDDEVEEVDSDEWEGEKIPVNDCLFCPHHSSTMEINLRHMTLTHSFFIPDLEFCTNVEALIEYLGEKVGSGYECIGCNWNGGKNSTLDSVQKHMKDKGHCVIHLDDEGLVEMSDFYDYSTSYPDAGTDNTCADDEVEPTVISGDDFQLVLPSGATIGHRSLNRYYRQRLNPNSSLVPVRKSSKTLVGSLLSQYRSLGWKGATSADVVRRARDIRFMKQMQAKNYLGLGKKGNTILQKHFRLQIMV